MKKVIISLSLIAAFFAYVVFKRFEGEGVIKPTKTTANPNVNQPTPSAPAAVTVPQANQTSSGSVTVTQPKPKGAYNDGTYVGSVADAYFGNVQVKAVIQGGKITDVQFLQYPNTHSYSIEVNSQAMPYLTQEAIQAQSANVDIVSGATQTSEAFVQSLGDALAKAKA